MAGSTDFVKAIAAPAHFARSSRANFRRAECGRLARSGLCAIARRVVAPDFRISAMIGMIMPLSRAAPTFSQMLQIGLTFGLVG